MMVKVKMEEKMMSHYLILMVEIELKVVKWTVLRVFEFAIFAVLRKMKCVVLDKVLHHTRTDVKKRYVKKCIYVHEKFP